MKKLTLFKDLKIDRYYLIVNRIRKNFKITKCLAIVSSDFKYQPIRDNVYSVKFIDLLNGRYIFKTGNDTDAQISVEFYRILLKDIDLYKSIIKYKDILL